MRTFISLALALAAALGSFAAQGFPVPGKPVRVIVGWAAGGPTDIQARAISAELSKQLGVPVTVENKPGASGAIGAVEVARATPDGHTLLYTVDGSVTQTPHLLKNLPLDPAKELVAVSRSTSGGVVLVAHPSVPAKNLPELIAYAKANPGKLSYSSFGTGTVSHIYGEVLAQVAGVPLVHVPYKGSSDAMRDLLSGRVQLMFDSPSIAGQYVASGQLRMIGAAGDKRRSTLPDVPTLLEQGVPGFEIRGWNGFFGPATMSPATVQAVNEALRRAQNTPEVKGTLLKMGFEPVDEPAADTAKLWRRDFQRWGEYIRRAKIQME
jgi:tripartite-type tricarboxylate transporter receptor subunit TctC